MKKQKAPIIPILIVFVLLGWIGYSQLPKPPPGPPKSPDQPKPDQADKNGQDVSSIMKQDPPKGPKKGPSRHVETSSLLKLPEASTKPKPNSTSTASQWYTKNADQSGGINPNP